MEFINKSPQKQSICEFAEHIVYELVATLGHGGTLEVKWGVQKRSIMNSKDFMKKISVNKKTDWKKRLNNLRIKFNFKA